MAAQSTKEAEKLQHARFIETARALGCDEDEAAFDDKLKAVVGPRSNIKSDDEKKKSVRES